MVRARTPAASRQNDDERVAQCTSSNRVERLHEFHGSFGGARVNDCKDSAGDLSIASRYGTIFSIPPSGYNVSLFASTTQMIGSLVTTELGAYEGSFPIASFSEEMGRQTGTMTAVFSRLCLDADPGEARSALDDLQIFRSLYYPVELLLVACKVLLDEIH